MSRAQWLVLIVMVPAIVVGGLVAGRALNHDDTTSGRLQVSSAAEATEFEFDFTIPSGTADRIAAGDDVEIVPAELVVKVGDAIRIVNHDTHDHIVGVFFVAAGETLTQRFNSVGVLSGECSVHSSGSFTLRVEA